MQCHYGILSQEGLNLRCFSCRFDIAGRYQRHVILRGVENGILSAFSNHDDVLLGHVRFNGIHILGHISVVEGAIRFKDQKF